MRAVDAIVRGLHHAWGLIEDGWPIVPRFPQRAYSRFIALSSPRGLTNLEVRHHVRVSTPSSLPAGSG